jgi:hypothetical protein
MRTVAVSGSMITKDWSPRVKVFGDSRTSVEGRSSAAPRAKANMIVKPAVLRVTKGASHRLEPLGDAVEKVGVPWQARPHVGDRQLGYSSDPRAIRASIWAHFG